MKDLVLAVVIIVLLVCISLSVDLNPSTEVIQFKPDNVTLVADDLCIKEENIGQVGC